MNGRSGRVPLEGTGAGERGTGADYLDGNALAGPLSEISSCSGVLLRLREDGGQAVLDLRGFSYLTVDLG